MYIKGLAYGMGKFALRNTKGSPWIPFLELLNEGKVSVRVVPLIPDISNPSGESRKLSHASGSARSG